MADPAVRDFNFHFVRHQLARIKFKRLQRSFRRSRGVSMNSCHRIDGVGIFTPLLADLLQCCHPVLDMISGRQLAIFHGEYIKRHGLEALASGLRSPEFARGRASRLTSHHNLIADGPDILNFLTQIGNR